MFLLDAEEVPHASSQDFDESGEEGQDGGLGDESHHRGRDGQRPRASEDQIEEDGYVVDVRVLVAEVIPKEAMLGSFL